MFPYTMRGIMSLPQLDRVRWLMFPQVRVNDRSMQQGALFDDKDPDADLPSIMRVMDIQQEQLARSLGDAQKAGRKLLRPGRVIGAKPGGVAIEPGEKRGPARRAERGGDEGMPEPGPLAPDAIKMWGLQQRMAGDPQRGMVVIIRQDEHDIGTRGTVLAPRGRGCEPAQQHDDHATDASDHSGLHVAYPTPSERVIGPPACGLCVWSPRR